MWLGLAVLVLGLTPAGVAEQEEKIQFEEDRWIRCYVTTLVTTERSLAH